MIELIPDVADNVVAVKGTGKITGDDYEQVIIPAIEEKLKTYDKIRMFVQLTPTFSGFDAKAMWDDARVGLKNLSHFEKIAVVTDTEWIAQSFKIFGVMTPGEVRIFSNEQFDEAKAWIVADYKPVTRTQILQSALICFSENGFHQTTMDDIVAQSGLSKGALYWHFKSKKELFIALAEWFILQIDQQIDLVWTDDMSAADKIRSMVEVTLAGSEQMVPFVNIFLDFWAQTPKDEQLQQIFGSIIDDYETKLEEIINEGVANGEFQPVENPRNLSLAMFGMLDALFLYYTLLGDKVDMRGSARAAVDVMLAGLTSKE
ncbi:MAG: STAS/SEC14 domain-containing protein [Anaerolineae bacterium]|nr:STAS/SEC14 domain-containing protein [Anaerolineae bacterium]